MKSGMQRSIAVKLAVKASGLLFNRVVHRPMQAAVRRFSRVGRGPFPERSQFDWIPRVEAGWTAARDELRALLRERERIPGFEQIAPGNLPHGMRENQWKSYWLVAYGRRIAENCRRCPGTMRLIGAIPGVKTAFFSILAPRTHIPEHTGPYAGVLRYHLGLIVPRRRDACRIRVGSQAACWEEGRSLVFDDSYPHEVWNDTDEERVVLFIDFARPLPFPVSALNEGAIRLASRSSIAQDIVDNAHRWNRRAAG